MAPALSLGKLRQFWCVGEAGRRAWGSHRRPQAVHPGEEEEEEEAEAVFALGRASRQSLPGEACPRGR